MNEAEVIGWALLVSSPPFWVRLVVPGSTKHFDSKNSFDFRQSVEIELWAFFRFFRMFGLRLPVKLFYSMLE
jgi:hypothetical protein